MLRAVAFYRGMNMAYYVLLDHGNDRSRAHVVGCTASTSREGMESWRDRMNKAYENEEQRPRRCRLYKLVPVTGEDVSDIPEVEKEPPKQPEEPPEPAPKVRTFRRRLKR
jgi:hypothetical protein